MCTVSWIVKDQHYWLYFNRDEKRSRSRAERPQIHWREGTNLIAPIDTQGGGSWIAVNEWGIAVFLLNHYAADIRVKESERFQSRGEIPMLVAAQSSFDGCLKAISEIELSRFRPFYVGVIDPLRGCQVYGWNGVGLERVQDDIPFVTTSSYRSEEVERYRRERFLEFFGIGGDSWNPDKALSFHMDLSHPNKAFNPLMSREDAETHCFSVVSITPSQVNFEYFERLESEASLDSAVVCSIKRKGFVS